MKTIAALAATFLALGSGIGIAEAATHHVATGTITRLEAPRHWLVLGHHTYRLGPAIAWSSLRKGEHVRVLYRMRDGHRLAYRVVPTSK